ncbi:MAG: DUF29 domain-containing protein [Synechococcus sp.]|nr:DUF29 domain-containing protein [Synechococcus sp.]
MRYEQDIVAWSATQAHHLKRKEWEQLDLEHLIEEIEALGRSEQRAFGSYLQVLMMHWLKWHYQPERRSKSWEHTVSYCRDQIQDALEDMPSLQRLLEDEEWLAKYYRRARRDAAKETQKNLNIFPEAMPFTVQTLLTADL